MLLVANIRVALRSLQVNRLRSALTMLGIVIGVAAVVAMVAIGTGARERIEAQIASLGANLISVSPGSVTQGGTRLGAGAGVRLTEDDAYAIEAEVPGVAAVAPAITTRGQFAYGPANWSAIVRGVTLGYFEAREWPVAEGRLFTPEELEGAAKVVLLGETVRQSLFGDADPVGEVVRVRDVPFTVIGVLEAKGQSLQGEDQDDLALAPLSTVRRQLIGTNRASPRQVWWILVKYAPEAEPEAVIEQIRGVLRQRHRLQETQEESFVIRNLAEVMETQAAATRIMTMLLAAIASVSLLVGGIGIMNIMLVSVTERTREIGLRMAVGARGRDILAQFLTEAATLTFIGGIVGILVGMLVSWVVATVAGWSVVVQPQAIAVAVLFSAAIGIFFGFYPARKAARLDPITALRYE